MPQPDDRTRAPEPQKRAYQPPTLREYGTVRDLTLANSNGGDFDGGSIQPNIYVS
jgi:hypothetical protein